MQKGLVSVLCLSMNHQDYIAQGARSIIDQTYKDIEVLFVDNNSRDKTFEIGDEVFKASGIKYRGFKRTENNGISANLNYVLDKAEGEFIAILSGDDWWTEDNVQAKVDLFNAHPEYGLVYSNGYQYFQVDGTQRIFYDKPQKSGHLFNDLLLGNLFSPNGVITRHDALKAIGNFDEGLTIEDWDMYIRMAQKYQIGYVQKPTFFSRMTGRNFSSNIKFMNDGYELYYKKYAAYPEMKLAKRNIEIAQAYQLSSTEPGLKSLMYILKRMQWRTDYFKHIARCAFGMLGFKLNKPTA